MKNNNIIMDVMLLKCDESEFTEEEFDTIVGDIIEFIESKHMVMYANAQLISDTITDEEK